MHALSFVLNTTRHIYYIEGNNLDSGALLARVVARRCAACATLRDLARDLARLARGLMLRPLGERQRPAALGGGQSRGHTGEPLVCVRHPCCPLSFPYP